MPAMSTLPLASTAMALPASSPLPPRNVENTRAPVESSLVTKASVTPRRVACNGDETGKLVEMVEPVT